ncbi:MAG: ATP-binding protein [Bacteroidales bacterium]
MTKLKFSKRYLFVPIVLIVFFLLFYLVYEDIKNRTISEFNTEQLILEETASKGITSFFNDYQSDLQFLSKLNDVIDFTDESKILLADFYKSHNNIIEAITRVDAHGIILFTYPYNKTIPRKDISNQEHVRKVIATHQAVISDVFMSVQGFLAIAIHVPVFKEGKFVGSLAILIPIDRLGEKYLGKIKIRGSGNVWLISENGIEIYCTVKGHKGKPFLENTENGTTAIELLKNIKKEKFGTAKCIHKALIYNGKNKFPEKYISFYKTTIGNTYWTIIISYQEEDVYIALAKLRNRLILIFLLLFFIMAYYFYSFAKVRNVLKEEAKRKKAEEILRESEAKFRTIFDESPIGIEIYNREGMQIDANPASLKMFGIPDISEIQNFNIFDGTSLDTGKKERLRKAQSVSYQSLFDFEKVKELHQYKTNKTGKAYFDYIITPLLNSDENTIDGYLLQVQDISEYKRAEEAILQSKNDWEDTFNSITDIITIHDKDFNIISANKAGKEILNLPALENHLKLKCYSYYHGTECPPAECPTCNCALRGLPGAIELFEPHLNRYLEIRAIPRIGPENEIVGLIHIVRDISERKHYDAELVLAKERAEESDKLKTAFLNNVSHEIRTPFNGLLGFLTIIKEDEVSPSEKEIYFNTIFKSADRLLSTINDIVEISQIDSSQIKLQIAKTDVNEQINDLFMLYKPIVENNNLEFILNNTLIATKSYFETDGHKFNTILTNLINNAIKFTKKGSIELGCRYISDSRETEIAETVELEFYVKDTGIGIPEDKHEQIFKRFMQADVSDTRAYEGSGLGLSIAKAYVEMLGGKIRLESEPGNGTAFYFTISCNKVVQDMDTIKNLTINEKAETEIKDLKILIADDDEISCMLIGMMFKANCKEILYAGNGIEAVEKCRLNPDLDFVLMDIKMPLLDGYIATKQIRQFNKDIIIIAQTAYALISDRERAMDAGCNDYIAKPFDKELLISIIDKHLKNKNDGSKL